MTMTPLPEMQDAVKAGTADPIFRAALALAALRTRDIHSARTADLERLLMQCRTAVNLLRLEIEDRAIERQRAQTTRQGRGAS